MTDYWNSEQHELLYSQSLADPEQFWSLQATHYVTWLRPWRCVFQGDLTDFNTRWFVDGKLNVCDNCIDRHLASRADKLALIWEGNHPSRRQQFTYHDLHTQINRFANVLKHYGVKKGDRVCIYLPMIPEIVITMLACARIGAIHSVVFAGFSSDALKSRMLDAECRVLITADEGLRGEKLIPLKTYADEALCDVLMIEQVIVVKHTHHPVPWRAGRDVWYHEAMAYAALSCPIEWMDANDPLFILYTSGSTGKPKGVVHGSGGYLVYVAMTFHRLFNWVENDVHWCTADVGWITGHSYLVYGPLCNGATTLLYEGIPSYPSYSRYFDIIERNDVSLFYTSPTAIRALRAANIMQNHPCNLSSLRVLGSVGEPLSPEVWRWFYQEVGQSRCPLINTWWQTETGGILISAFPGASEVVPGASGWPFLGIEVAVVDDEGQVVKPNQSGYLVVKRSWPGIMLTVYRDQARFKTTYLTPMRGCYYSGDGAFVDTTHQLWITGRIDDVIKVSGHRLGSGEIESALISHPAVAEAAVVGLLDELKGEVVVAFVHLRADNTADDTLQQQLIQCVRRHVGAIAAPQIIHWAPFGLPKTRSGKIVRRVLRMLASHQYDDLGDLSTLADRHALDEWINAMQQR